MKLEIERKFLLKSLPEINPIDVIKIEQFYLKNKSGVWERARVCDSKSNGVKYVHTVKTSVMRGVNMEDEHDMTEEEFNSFKKMCYESNSYRFIKKERNIYPNDDGLIWEVDDFRESGYSLVVAELEIPDKDYILNIPSFINKRLIMEVTDFKQLSSRNLAKKIS